jgi:hypothetical protein
LGIKKMTYTKEQYTHRLQHLRSQLFWADWRDKKFWLHQINLLLDFGDKFN